MPGPGGPAPPPGRDDARLGAAVRLVGLHKRFPGGAAAVDGVDLEIGAGEFFSLLGPSGCGKTTTLRMIAGFETPEAGTVSIGGRDLAGVPVHRRNIGMVFQSYALLPHRTVAENVAFGLRMRKVGRAERDTRVAQALAAVALTGFADRRPAQLSGGQQQRVALARALVIRPPLLLCDEPLGALDRKLRQQMQVELKALQRSLGVTLVFVTHDQEEALAMSDRIGVMNAGRLEQVGTPAEIYDRPASRFVAGFIGEINLFEGVAGPSGLVLPDGRALPCPAGVAGAGTLAVRPERLGVTGAEAGVLRGVVSDVSFVGESALVRVAVAGLGPVLVRTRNTGAAAPPEGAEVGLAWRAEDGVVLPGAGG